ncbi:MAG: LysR family transcriptional regulator [Lachnospiraceae bacterium]|nr:LysR family transcriptional regulator [Lachnospiraceae bacterium]
MWNEINVKCFLEVAKTLNFTAAAANLYMTQQAVSKQVSALENYLGFALFQRSHHAVRLTEEGARLAVLLQRFEVELEETLLSCRAVRRQRNNALKFGFPSRTFFRGTSPAEAYYAMREQIPDFSAEGEMHSPGTLLRRLADRNLDIVVVPEHMLGKSREFCTLPLQDMSVNLLISEKLAQACENPSFECFSGYPLLLAEADSAVVEQYGAPEFYLRFGFHPEQVNVRSNMDAVFLGMELGLGVALGSDFSAIDGLPIAAYPSGYREKLLCVWRWDGNRALCEKYAKCLADAFKKIELKK